MRMKSIANGAKLRSKHGTTPKKKNAPSCVQRPLSLVGLFMFSVFATFFKFLLASYRALELNRPRFLRSWIIWSLNDD